MRVGLGGTTKLEIIGIRRSHFCSDRRGRYGKSVVRCWINNWPAPSFFGNLFHGSPPAERLTPRYGEFRTQSSDVLERQLGRLRRGVANVSTQGESREKIKRGGPLASLSLADVAIIMAGEQGGLMLINGSSSGSRRGLVLVILAAATPPAWDRKLRFSFPLCSGRCI